MIPLSFWILFKIPTILKNWLKWVLRYLKKILKLLKKERLRVPRFRGNPQTWHIVLLDVNVPGGEKLVNIFMKIICDLKRKRS